MGNKKETNFSVFSITFWTSGSTAALANFKSSYSFLMLSTMPGVLISFCQNSQSMGATKQTGDFGGVFFGENVVEENFSRQQQHKSSKCMKTVLLHCVGLLALGNEVCGLVSVFGHRSFGGAGRDKFLPGKNY